MFKVPKKENLAKLTAEQRKVYDNWVREEETHTLLTEKILVAMAAGDKVAAHDYIDQLQGVTPDICEHDCSIWDDCSQCIEIERILYPDDIDVTMDKKYLN